MGRSKGSWEKNPVIKPYLKWAGGKRQLLPVIKTYLPECYDTYYEPFLGAGALFFDLQPPKAVINDCNGQLMTTYRVVKDHVDALISCLEYHKERYSKEYFYQVRQMDREPGFQELSNVEKAARLIFLNKTCYNGLYRVNGQGLFNVPFGRYKNPAICETEVLKAIHQYFNQNDIKIVSGDFEQALSNANQRSFVYFDPPYHSDGNTNFTGYQAGGFGECEQVRLRDVYRRLTGRNVRCLLSNSDTPFIRELYQDFTVITVQAKRAINADRDGRGAVNEVLVRNW